MLEKKNKLMRPSIDLTEPRICRVVEICNDEGRPLVRGSKVSADGVEIVTIGTWDPSARAFEAVCLYWRTFDLPQWTFVAVRPLDPELQMPAGWVKRHAEFSRLFRTFDQESSTCPNESPLRRSSESSPATVSSVSQKNETTSSLTVVDDS